MDKLNFSFGILIAYFIPGFIFLYAIAPFSQTVDFLLRSNTGGPSGASLLPIILLSLGSGMIVNSITAASLRKVFEQMGALPPTHEDLAKLKGPQLSVHSNIIKNSYRYFECYANMTTSLTILVLSMIAKTYLKFGPSVNLIIQLVFTVMIIMCLFRAAYKTFKAFSIRMKTLLNRESEKVEL